ncbi:MAG: SIS domain-containing protein [Candidatus Methanoliparum thermophilum]|uniref:SIS domain-containing protein n=1 Tax=Methanoliparum thermophilum TaxID=2491083 RepID=A0A520KQH0_METT2|nr:6-phospho-3-hexuloisomerase [Candidatus Methanoliparum sp. LAM-1]RZN63811.1 MAG: SIS domain-containing protein [Candidatus Methanoliparum thermophilum]BDC36465.1 hypothetical protein MTLP_11470 [Candidatus Methanoliparum sp. LAM-1]
MSEIYKESVKVIIRVINDTVEQIDKNDVENLENAILTASKVFLIGLGRSGLVAKGFAMRLMHIGIDTYVVMETITPAASNKDLLIVISSSGNKGSLIEITKLAKKVGMTVVSITSNPDSLIGNLSDKVVFIPKVANSCSLAPLNTFFEDTVMVFTDGVIAELMNKMGKTESDMKKRHSILE